MANNQYVNKIVYGGNTLIDLTADTVTASTLLSGYTAHDASGAAITGTLVPSTTGIVVIEEEDEHGGTIKHITAIDLSNDTVAANRLQQGYTAHDRFGNAITGTLIPSGGTIENQDKTVTPTKATQRVTADVGYTGLGTVTVNPIPSEYIIPSGELEITANGTADVTAYASVDVDVQPSLQSKSATPSESAQTISPDTGYDGLSSVSVGAISSTYVGSGIERRDDTDLTASGATVSVPAGYYAEAESKSVATAVQATPNVEVNTSTGLVTATATQTAGYVSAGSKSGALQLTTTGAATITPTESAQTAVAKNVYTTGAVTVGAISSTYVGSGITRRDDTDLTVSGATVTVPSGYYASQETKSVASGSVTSPTSISGTSATVSAGTNTLTLTKTVSVTPRVTTAGYVSAGTAGNSSVSLTASVTTKAAATITPGTSNQTIASGTYLTGTQTISGDANLVGSNILSGKSIFGVAGTVAFQTYYSGSGTPASSLGVNGDIYLKTS